jgi:hypothetical protein
VVNYMVRLLNEATPDLPPVIQNQTKELGRITSIIALSVKAQILTTAASPLFNGNPDYVSVKNKDGQALFNPVYDAGKWDKAAAACQAAVLECEKYGLKLHTFQLEGSIDHLSDSLKTELSTQTAITSKWEDNTELIWALTPTSGYQSYCFPRLTSKSASNVFCRANS